MAGQFVVKRQALRRGVLLGTVLGIAAAKEAASAVDKPPDVLMDALAVVVAAMTERHGGIWGAHIDHDTGFILIQPKIGQGPL